MACGAPVIAASCSSLPEITADSALYFEPDSEDELLKALDRVTEDEKLRSNMIGRGLKRKSGFSWDKTVRDTIEVYKVLLHG